mmetsp:Transcript_32158/g.67599  ORF Transcript_32158/g.67599 Transcript_32158/m.67599 type:complete len:796 (-) Transcript_32158:293-2680(-)
MFQKEGSSTIGGKKDVPLRKSDRRRLRDRVVDALFVGGNENAEDEEWITRAEKLIDDAIIASKGGDMLSRKLKLPSGEHATLFLRTPSGPVDSSSSSTPPSAVATNGTLSYDGILKSFPTVWPYHQSTQPILLEYEDADRKVHLTPLLPLLAALPPPLSSPPLEDSMTYTLMESADATTTENSNDAKKYRIPNIVVHPAVSKYICRGADLMKSGIRSFPSPWTLRQSKGLVTISIIGNPQPVAVGMIEKGLFREYCYSKNGNPGGRANWRAEALNLVGMGKKGVGVMIVNCYGDDLWKNSLPIKAIAFGNVSTEGSVGNPLGGGVYDDGNFGNAGFLDGMNVYPILDMGGDGESRSDNGENEDGDDNENEDATAGMKQLYLSDNNKEESAVTSEGALTESATDDSQEDGKSEKNQEAEPEPDHNDILENAFYASLLILLSSKTPLPMPVSIYYGKHLLAAVPTTGPRLDMKQTTHKKIGSFLKEMESDGVIKLGASKDGKDQCAFLTDIVKNNPELIQFKRHWKKEIAASGGNASIAGAATPQKPKLAVVDLFIVPNHVSERLQLDKDAVMAANAKTDERKGTGFLTKKECCALIEKYIEKEELIDPKGKGRVLVNGPLCDALYRISKKSKQSGQDAEYPTSVKRKELIERWMDRMDRGHALVQMPGSKILQLGRGGPKPVDIEVEFRQGNRRKFLTRIRGMEEYGVDGEKLSQDVAHRFACSSSALSDPVGRPALKKGRVELVLQGHLSEELTALLTGDESLTSHGGVKGSEYSLPKTVINVVLRKGIPARKKR